MQYILYNFIIIFRTSCNNLFDEINRQLKLKLTIFIIRIRYKNSESYFIILSLSYILYPYDCSIVNAV